MANECIPFYEDGDELTVQADAALTGKRFVEISANKDPASFALAADAVGGNFHVNYPSAGGLVFGVTMRDVASGAKVGVWRGKGMIIPVTAGASVARGDELQVDTTGRVITATTGVKVGRALTAATVGNDAMVTLY